MYLISCFIVVIPFFFIGLRTFNRLPYNIPVVKYNLSSHFLFSLTYEHRITLKFMSDDSYLSQSFTLCIICLLGKICLFHNDPFLQEQTWLVKRYPIQSAPLKVQTLLKKFLGYETLDKLHSNGDSFRYGENGMNNERKDEGNVEDLNLKNIVERQVNIYSLIRHLTWFLRVALCLYTSNIKTDNGMGQYFIRLLSFSCFQTDCPNQTPL